ncbi:CRTAC1 family protein [Pseudosulfitobacter koreensis]|uniref:CRTAC1 family protein n=1 Tax=Pseudosulfitobacter koreensis TaxID=2968472 RepID=A0ABT1Z3U0_9RHOB|nr:CRTAC1 family protein [Pseudosulfitobacter koreense]MCR8827785.1 CRTAC1 family protein [Pseudosulfitobacter koreense]
MRANLALILSVGVAHAEPQFTPVAVPHHQYDGGWEHFVGGGLAALDCNADGRTDLVAAGGSNLAAVFVNESDEAIRLRMKTLPVTGTTGVYALDIDNDTHLDLVLLRVGPDQIWLGDGTCGFAPAEMIDFPDKWTTAFSATWEQDQTRPTLAMGHYVDRFDPDGPFQACDTNSLWRPEGDGWTHTILEPGYCPLSALFTDWARSGQADLRLSNDRHYYVSGGSEQLWQMGPEPRLYTEADGWATHLIWGMGIATRDLDRDGRDEVFLSSMGDQRLQRPTGDGPGYADVPFDVGSTAHRPYTGGDGRPSTGWHIAFGDVQNDGLDDAFIAKGNVQQMPGMAMEDPNNLLIAQPDGTFAEAGETAGVASLHRGRGAALVDLNNDGLLDLAVVNRRAAMEVWQNTSGTTGNWLALDLTQPAPNTRAIGAWIEVDDGTSVQSRELVVGGGHAGGSDAPQHFGLGAATSVRVRVKWPDAPLSDWVTVGTNARYMLRPDAAPAAY